MARRVSATIWWIVWWSMIVALMLPFLLHWMDTR